MYTYVLYILYMYIYIHIYIYILYIYIYIYIYIYACVCVCVVCIYLKHKAIRILFISMEQRVINWPPNAIPLFDLRETWTDHSEKILLFGRGMTLVVTLLRY